MKRFILTALCLVFLLSMILGFVNLVYNETEAVPCQKCHLVWDDVDKVWWCLGSPVDCCCTELEEQ